MNKRHILLAALASVLATSQAAAQNFSCRVLPAAYLGLNGAGMLSVGVEGAGIQQICSVNQDLGGVSATVCTGWYSSLQVWRTTGKTGWLYYDPNNPANGGGGKTACSQFANWDLRIPYHFEAG